MISTKEKILFILECVLALAIIVFAIIGFVKILPSHLVSTIDLGLLSALLFVNAVRSFPKKKVNSVVYTVACVLSAVGAIVYSRL